MPGEPANLAEYIIELHNKFDNLSSQIYTLHGRFDDLADMIEGQYWSSAAFVCRGIADVFTQVGHNLYFAGNSVDYWLGLSLTYIDTNVPWEASEVTWQVICEAWIKNDFEGRATTIALIDRMRQILWDEPFYAVFAGRPEETEF